MAQGEFKVGQVIEVSYQALNSQSSLTVTMEIYDETHAKDGVNFPDVTMTEFESSGRYYGSFTPDVEGIWNVAISDAAGRGKVIKQFAVAGHDIDAIGDAVATLNDVSTVEVNAEVDTALADYDGPTKAELDASESNIRGADSDTLKSLSDQLDSVSNPPMVG